MPGIKACLGYSLIAGIAGGLMGAALGFKWHPDNMSGVFVCIVMYAGMIFVISFVTFLILAGIGRRREKKLEREATGEDEEDAEDE